MLGLLERRYAENERTTTQTTADKMAQHTCKVHCQMNCSSGSSGRGPVRSFVMFERFQPSLRRPRSNFQRARYTHPNEKQIMARPTASDISVRCARAIQTRNNRTTT